MGNKASGYTFEFETMFYNPNLYDGRIKHQKHILKNLCRGSCLAQLVECASLNLQVQTPPRGVQASGCRDYLNK